MATPLLSLPESQQVEIPDAAWQQAQWLPSQLRAEAPVACFTVGDLLRLEVNSVVDSGTPAVSDISIRVNGAAIGSAALTMVDNRMAIRLSRLA
jgi:flagellar motor switch/type III secretory pathway protein FliN